MTAEAEIVQKIREIELKYSYPHAGFRTGKTRVDKIRLASLHALLAALRSKGGA